MKNKLLYSFKKYFNNFDKSNILLNFRERFLFMLFSVVILRIGSFIPMYGINLSIILNELTKNFKYNTLLNIYNLFSGGSLNRISIFSIGIMPYISSTILIQVLTTTVPYFKKLKNNNYDYNKKNILNMYICIFTLLFSIIHSLITIINLHNIFYINENTNIISCNILLSIISLISGTMIMIWLSEQISNYGIGNGISIIILISIISGIPNNIKNLYFNLLNKNINILSLFIALFIIYILIYISIFVESSQRKITINYPKQYFFGKNFLKSSSTYLPIKVNIPGVMPPIFSSSLMIFPNLIFKWIGLKTNLNIVIMFSEYLYPGKIIYSILYVLLIFIFSYIYSPIVINVKETSDNLKKSGAFISNIRPGENTFKYIKEIVNKLIFIGSCYISFMCLVSEVIKNLLSINIDINGTSILIITIIIIEIVSQIQSIIISTKYDSIFKKII